MQYNVMLKDLFLMLSKLFILRLVLQKLQIHFVGPVSNTLSAFVRRPMGATQHVHPHVSKKIYTLNPKICQDPLAFIGLPLLERAGSTHKN